MTENPVTISQALRIEAHQGTLEAESVKGKGTSFIIQVPKSLCW